ncbi:MAG: single-stranded DNA-binding protein [Mycobacteriaceae bacterium]|nr:single-stranded DNA-binding protein [Mycobacteriaceae bacterium]
MFETPLTVVGNIVNDPQRRTVGDQEVMRFRVASNSRRRGADGKWEAGNSLFITVHCWGRLVRGVGAALGKGSPVIVVGHIYTSEYDDRDGVRRSSLEMRATSVGPDVSRVLVSVDKTNHPDGEAAPAADGAAAPQTDEAAPQTDEAAPQTSQSSADPQAGGDVDDDTQTQARSGVNDDAQTDGGTPVGRKGLALSA